MKKKVFLTMMLTLCLFFVCGCGAKNLESASIVRDEARVGGSLSFVYDQNGKTVYIGGENEVVQYSAKDESRGLEEGNRVGLKVTAPNEKLELESATLEMNGITYSAKEFLESVEGNLQRFFYVYPYFSKNDDIVKFCVKWQDGTKEQCYKIYIVEGTRFMDKSGNVE
ncbi:MAG: hypothetical protein J6J24_03335 [Clostridia bacterium]|nr:hypothetical protein [Clostridia bacterium]